MVATKSYLTRPRWLVSSKLWELTLMYNTIGQSFGFSTDSPYWSSSKAQVYFVVRRFRRRIWDRSMSLSYNVRFIRSVTFTENENVGDCDYGGCPDPNAINYDPNATFDDGSCYHYGPYFIDDGYDGIVVFTVDWVVADAEDCATIVVNSGEWPEEVSWNINCNDGSSIMEALLMDLCSCAIWLFRHVWFLWDGWNEVSFNYFHFLVVQTLPH